MPHSEPIQFTDRKWRLIERLGIALLLIGLAGLVTLHLPTYLVQYFDVQELPVLNLPSGLADAVGVSKKEYEDTLVDAPYVLELPSQEIRAHIIPGVDHTDERAYWQALKKGVALAKASAPLEAETGNSFIFGHSGRITLNPSPYDTIFADLPDVKIGDEVRIRAQGVLSTYRVTASRSVAADDLRVLEDVNDKRVVTLMTCWPLGTWYKRWVVVAELIPG